MIDTLIIIAYFLIVLYVGIRSGRKIKTISQYTIGDRNFSTTTLVATLTATLIGGGTTLGLAEKTFTLGLIFPLAYCGICISRYIEASFISGKMEAFFGLISAGDIMEKLYGKYAKILTGIATLTTSIFILGAHITAMGFLFDSLLGIPLDISLILGTLTVIIYSGYGGIKSVSFTDVAQLFFMLVAIPLVCILGLVDIGGFSAIMSTAPIAHLDFRYLSLSTIIDHGAIFISYALPALFPVMIQRMLMSKNIKQIKDSLLLNSLLSGGFYLLVAIIGLIVLAKAPDSDPKLAFPYLIKEVLPVGFRGLAVAGLLAVIMSTVDSFINLIGVTVTHDILHPLIGQKLNENKQLLLARITGCLAGITGLISALYFNGILENVFASMNLWIPYIFPPLFLGIIYQNYAPRAFFTGLAAAFIVSMLIKYFGILPGFSGTLCAAAANGVLVIIFTKVRKPRNIKNIPTIKYNLYKYIKSQLISPTKNNGNLFQIFSVFALFFSTLPIIASTGMGDKLAPIAIGFNLVITSMAVLIIFNGLWANTWLKERYHFLTSVFLIVTLFSHPIFTILSFGISLFLVVNLCLGFAILYLLSNEITSLALLLIGTITAIVIYIIYPSHNFEQSSMPQAIETFVRFIALMFFLVTYRKQVNQKINDYDSLSGIMAHEIGHSIVSMNFIARRLKNTLPSLSKNQNTIALENLVERLENNAEHTNNAIKIIQAKFGINSTQNKVSKFPISEAIFTAIKTSSIENIANKIEIIISKRDFQIQADYGSIIHVFINLIKNSTEALLDIKNPMIIININPAKRSVSIIDNGKGISALLLPKMFNEDFSTKANGKGKGLYFCKMVIELFGGNIRCKSQQNKTSFIIYFPNTDPGDKS